jgi:hypothetical protein
VSISHVARARTAVLWTAVAAWMVVSPLLLLRPLEGATPFVWILSLDLPRTDLLGHTFLFWLGATVALAAAGDDRALSGGRRWTIVGLVAGYAAVLEALQYFVPGRAFQASDIVANSTGTLLALWGSSSRGRLGWSSPGRPASAASVIAARPER